MDDVRAFVDACQAFFSHLAAVSWTALVLAVALHLLKLVLRVRAWQNILRASYPDTRVRYRDVLGAYLAGVGVNSITPARGGDLVKLYLVKRRVRDRPIRHLDRLSSSRRCSMRSSRAPCSCGRSEQGVLPGVPDLPRLPAFDWTFAIEHPTAAAFIGCVLLAGAVDLAGWASSSVTALRGEARPRVRGAQGPWTFVRGVVSWQAASWVARFAAVYFFLRAFHIEASVEATALTVFVVQSLDAPAVHSRRSRCPAGGPRLRARGKRERQRTVCPSASACRSQPCSRTSSAASARSR